MSHNGRIWYVECCTDHTNEFVMKNLASVDAETSILKDALIEVKRSGSKTLYGRRNLVEVAWRDIKVLKKHQKKLKLSFLIYMRESRGAKITAWRM